MLRTVSQLVVSECTASTVFTSIHTLVLGGDIEPSGECGLDTLGSLLASRFFDGMVLNLLSLTMPKFQCLPSHSLNPPKHTNHKAEKKKQNQTTTKSP